MLQTEEGVLSAIRFAQRCDCGFYGFFGICRTTVQFRPVSQEHSLHRGNGDVSRVVIQNLPLGTRPLQEQMVRGRREVVQRVTRCTLRVTNRRHVDVTVRSRAGRRAADFQQFANRSAHRDTLRAGRLNRAGSRQVDVRHVGNAGRGRRADRQRFVARANLADAAPLEGRGSFKFERLTDVIEKEGCRADESDRVVR